MILRLDNSDNEVVQYLRLHFDEGAVIEAHDINPFIAQGKIILMPSELLTHKYKLRLSPEARSELNDALHTQAD